MNDGGPGLVNAKQSQYPGIGLINKFVEGQIDAQTSLKEPVEGDQNQKHGPVNQNRWIAFCFAKKKQNRKKQQNDHDLPDFDPKIKAQERKDHEFSTQAYITQYAGKTKSMKQAKAKRNDPFPAFQKGYNIVQGSQSNGKGDD
jgi:hypothetical protein